MGKRGNGEGSIYEHKRDGKKVGYRGSYTVYTAVGAKRRYVSGKTREEVRPKLAKAIAGRDSGLVVDDKNMTVGEYLDTWISDCVRGTVRESTFSRDKYLIANHIRPTLGRVKLKNLNALHLQGLYRDRLDRGISDDKGLSGSTVQKIHHVLHKALSQAVKWDLIPHATPPTRSRLLRLPQRRCTRSPPPRPGGCSRWRETSASEHSTCWPSTPA